MRWKIKSAQVLCSCSLRKDCKLIRQRYFIRLPITFEEQRYFIRLPITFEENEPNFLIKNITYSDLDDPSNYTDNIQQISIGEDYAIIYNRTYNLQSESNLTIE